ncbi:MAG: hypothetical protein AAF552_13455 [Pseudomonadota bacterium]
MIARTRQFAVALLAALSCTFAAAQTGSITFNQLHNPEFRGNGGSPAGNVTGEVPSLWRTFAVGESTATSAIVPLAADAIFPGSPPVNAVELTVTNFGPPATSDAGFDSSPNQFTLLPELGYGATVYLRSNNSDMSSQTVLIQLPIFDEAGVFTGNAGSQTVEVTDTWTQFEVPPIATSLMGASAELSFRLTEGASDNSIQIALPEVIGPSLENRVPNPEFSGTGGGIQGNVTGIVPEFWRAFGLESESASIALQTVPVAANELYPGSPATTAMRITSVNATGAGFDHEITQVPLAPAGRLMVGEVFLRADNADSSDQEVGFAVPIFESNGTFTGTAPGSAFFNATPQWQYFAGIVFSGGADQTANVAFRLTDSGTENSVLIALPTLNGLARDVFANGFEGDDPAF